MKKSPMTAGVLLAGAAIVTACAVQSASTVVTSGTVVRNVTIVNTRNGTLAKDMALWIEKGTIRQVLPSSALRTAGDVPVDSRPLVFAE